MKSGCDVKKKVMTLEKVADIMETAMRFRPGKSEEIARFRRIADFLLKNTKKWKTKKGIIFLCIGTDRSTGDSLGPLIGYKIQNLEQENIKVFGTLDEPVHANNLGFYTRKISKEYPDWFVIAVDAAVGNENDVGTVSIHMGSIEPGAGLGKNLNRVGDISIVGIIAPENFANYLNTIRLSKVMKLADFICEGITGLDFICGSNKCVLKLSEDIA